MKTFIKTLKSGGKTYIVKDKNHGFDLYELKDVEIKEDGEPTGKFKQVESWVGFMPTLDKVAYRLFHLELSSSDASTLGEILTVVNGTCKMIKAAGWTDIQTCDDHHRQ